MTAPTPLIAGNWKMNGLTAALAEARNVAAGVSGSRARVAICPPSTLIQRMSEALAGSSVLVGGQDCHPEISGAYTGDIAAEMLADAGASVVILGHSERQGRRRPARRPGTHHLRRRDPRTAQGRRCS
jgi:triosephosphate isomerase